jgi:hypothetical protein
MTNLSNLHRQIVNNHRVFAEYPYITFEDQEDGFSFYVILENETVIDYSEVWELPKWCLDYLKKNKVKINL